MLWLWASIWQISHLISSISSWQTFSVNGQILSILDFTVLSLHCNYSIASKAAIEDNMQINGYVWILTIICWLLVYLTIFLISLKTHWFEEVLWVFPWFSSVCLWGQIQSALSFLLDSGSQACDQAHLVEAETLWSVHLEHLLWWRVSF